ncbi:ATP-grasp domain-containing protein [Bacillus shivajii]|uniref:acetyl-CoA carboxylase biotin carboxylase subunit n=1 Tax=Bacillus shivajii TaxID=1983719 RepID=UPI001CFB1CDC|nr:biotin carboxylase N-terminal domain-containing protein [Bacillus shivajii]UCZ54281.1 ATP-grasp domain-containing protein [Bacillus shivajii]
MYNKILIANRGEIAVRIIKTCKRLGIKTIAVYSEADKESVHVKMADESFLLGGSRVNESYLNMDRVLEAAKTMNADAVHPGYGFLSENTEFAKKAEDAGITFIGPKSGVIEKMGNKIQARESMVRAEVPVIPGKTLSNTDESTVLKAAREIGYPVMLKAAAGGGGIGMQKVDHEKEMMKVLPSVMKKAETFFGSAEVYLEKFIENPRHIEAQIAGDESGNVVCLGERDCSIQRRHQKIVEEAPSTFLSNEGRKKLFDTAVKAGEAISYTNVGTVEFLVDENENIYFLEMNTRLQVEHPVTEEVTGLDLVEWQIHLALGKEIATFLDRGDTAVHAIEVRIYAEDPKTFFPSPGKLETWQFPEQEGIRYDFGVEEGATISPFYDPMIGKVIGKGTSRDDVIEKLIHCLEQAEVKGIKTNIPMLLDTLRHSVFKEGKATTNFVQEYFILASK